MKNSICVCVILLLSVAMVAAQGSPFESFRKAVKEERAGFAGNKEKLSRVFNAERIRLGQAFEAELWKYLDDDPEKHFWIGSFLTHRSYLHGNEPLPELAFKIRERAVKLLENRSDKESLGRKVTIYRDLAVSSKLSGKQNEAVHFREKAQALEKRDDLGAYISGLNEYEFCVYQNIDGSITDCKESAVPKERIVSRGWMNKVAIDFVKPIYPADLREKIKAQVEVRIMTDTAGNVISAEVIRGPSAFHKAAIEAAMKTKFSPMTLSGQPVKTSGWLSYIFTP